MNLDNLEGWEMYFGPQAMSSLDEEFKETTNYILLKYIYVLKSKLQLNELKEEIKIVEDEKIKQKIDRVEEILNKEEKMILMMLEQQDTKVLNVLKNMEDIQGFYITKDYVPVPDFFYSLNLRDYKHARPFNDYKNAIYNCFFMDYVFTKTILEELKV